MSVIKEKPGILIVKGKPNHQPPEGGCVVALEEFKPILYVYSGTSNSWNQFLLKTKSSYTGGIIPDNSDIGESFQAVVNAIKAIKQDGNNTDIARSAEDNFAPPTTTEVVDAKEGDSATISYETGKVAYWNRNATTWVKKFVIDYKQGLVSTYENTSSINLTKTGQALKADLKISATQKNATVIVKSDGLSVEVADEVKPTAYYSKNAAITALGAGKKFIYAESNYDGQKAGSVCWT